MLIYIVVFFVSISCILISEKKSTGKNAKKILVFLAILAPSVLAGVRDYTIGSDVLIYGNYWFKWAVNTQDLGAFLQSANRGGIGYGYALLNFLISRFTENPHWFYFILAFLEMVVLYLALRPYKDRINVAYGFFIFFCIYYNDSLNNLRQMPAMLIILLSFTFVRKRKLLLFIISMFFAMLFHVTAVAGFIIYPLAVLSESKLKKVFNILLFVAMLICVINFVNVLDIISNLNIISMDRYLHYITEGDVSGGRIIRIVLFSFLLFIFSITRKKLVAEYKEINSLFMYMIFSCILTFILFVFYSAYIIRVAYYYDIFMVLYIPYIVNKMKMRYGNYENSPKYILCGCVFFVYWLIVYVIRNGANTVPYIFMQ